MSLNSAQAPEIISVPLGVPEFDLNSDAEAGAERNVEPELVPYTPDSCHSPWELRVADGDLSTRDAEAREAKRAMTSDVGTSVAAAAAAPMAGERVASAEASGSHMQNFESIEFQENGSYQGLNQFHSSEAYVRHEQSALSSSRAHHLSHSVNNVGEKVEETELFTS